MLTRKVQKVGYSTLVVTLPKEWVDEVGVSRGDTVTFEKEEDGSLRMFLGIKQKAPLKCVINADLCDEPELLTRIITGNYIVGRDTIQIVSKGKIRREHLQEIRDTTRHLTGIGIVEQTSSMVTIQNFIDPTKFPVYGLVRRLHVLTWSLQNSAIRAFLEKKPELIDEALSIEDEVDRVYWLITRQLFLAAQDMRIMKEVGLSPAGHGGCRLVAKSIEEMADYAEDIAREASKIKDLNYLSYNEITNGIAQLSEFIQTITDKSLKSLYSVDVKVANDVIEAAKLANEEERKLGEKIVTQIRDVQLVVSLKAIIRSLTQIAKIADVIAEIAINATLEKSNELCRIEVNK